MFLRKLMVIVVPLCLMAALCLLLPLAGKIELYFFSPVVKGLLLGVSLALLLPLSGASKKREPFAGLLWVPAFLSLALLVWQYLASTGVSVPVLDLLQTTGTDALLVESAFCGYMLTQCVRTGK